MRGTYTKQELEDKGYVCRGWLNREFAVYAMGENRLFVHEVSHNRFEVLKEYLMREEKKREPGPGSV